MHLRNLTLWQIELLPWYAFAIVWIIAAWWRKATKTIEPAAARLIKLLFNGTAFILLFAPWTRVGFLGERVFPPIVAVEWAGIALTFAGAALAIWARVILGQNWSSQVSLKFGHELIRSGPYAYVRHPIYSGLLVAVIGTTLKMGEWRALLAIGLFAIAHGIKARREERLLTSEFGESYAQYRQHTGSLLPKF